MLDTPIIVSDEEIKAGEWCYCNEGGFYKANNAIKPNETYKKVIAGVNSFLQSPMDFSALSEEDCSRIGFVDVGKLALETYRDNPNDLRDADYKYMTDLNAPRKRRAFVRGFQAAQKLNEKKFSLEDMANLWQFIVDGAKQLMLSGTTEVSSFNDYVKSLQQPKVFDIEVEMEEVVRLMSADIVEKENWVKVEDSKYTYHRPKITNNRIKITKIL